jgi:hypothetical protein
VSLVFSDTVNNSGIIQHIEKTCGFEYGDITSNPKRFQYFTELVNLASSRVHVLIFDVGGTWQYDDHNHPDYNIITTDLITNQRDYPFVSDGSGNLVLEVQDVLVKDRAGIYRKIHPVDVPTGAPVNYTDGRDITGEPITYDKLQQSIFLDPIPDYDSIDGLKLYISREGIRFTVSDTTKKAGFAGLFHEYLVLAPTYKYMLTNNMKPTNGYGREVAIMEQAIQEYYRKREKDVVKTMRPRINRSR